MMRRRIRRRLRSVFQRTRVERELELELQFHLEMLAAQKARAGLPPGVAERAARHAFGGLAGVKDDVRDVWLGRRIEAAIEDVRYGMRTLRAAPGFALATILTIALAVGINTAIFATAYALLLRPLPFDAPEQLVVLHHGTGSPDRSAFSVGELEDYRRTPGLDQLAELHTMWFILLSPPGQRGDRLPERVSTGVVSPNTCRRHRRERATAARRAPGRRNLFPALPEQPAVDTLARPIEPAGRGSPGTRARRGRGNGSAAAGG